MTHPAPAHTPGASPAGRAGPWRPPLSCRPGGLLLTTLLLLLGTGGCSRHQSPEDQPVIDQSLMACLGAIRAYHRQADVHLASGDVREAIAAVEQILDLRCVGLRNPEIQEAVLDAYGRLGRLHLRLGEIDTAAKRVQQGLDRGGPPSFFRANLLMVQGDVLEAQARAADRQGKTEQAKALRRQAIGAFDRSARMNKRLLEVLVQ